MQADTLMPVPLHSHTPRTPEGSKHLWAAGSRETAAHSFIVIAWPGTARGWECYAQMGRLQKEVEGQQQVAVSLSRNVGGCRGHLWTDPITGQSGEVAADSHPGHGQSGPSTTQGKINH